MLKRLIPLVLRLRDARRMPQLAILRPEEDDIVGSWRALGSTVFGDEGCRRIHYVIKNVLEPVGVSPNGWEALFRDPRDGRLWERTYPQSEMHGGGPPRLIVVSAETAEAKYGVSG